MCETMEEKSLTNKVRTNHLSQKHKIMQVNTYYFVSVINNVIDTRSFSHIVRQLFSSRSTDNVQIEELQGTYDTVRL